jgi:hypothetical protein
MAADESMAAIILKARKSISDNNITIMAHRIFQNHTRIFFTGCSVAAVICCFVCNRLAIAETQLSVTLVDIESGLPNPQGHYRWMDVADQIYAETYRNNYNYTHANVQVDYFTGGTTLHGLLTAMNLKPHFAYQFKFVSYPGTASNESIGLVGRWWQEEWNGSEWTNGRNLNNKGNGSSPNPNDGVYFSRRDIPDSTSPTGKKYKYVGYLVFAYFITDENGNASFSFQANSSYHVLWKTSQRAHTTQDGLLIETTFIGGSPDPVGAYDIVYPEAMVSIFGEWERLPVGGVMLPPGNYEGEFVLTEESFHGSGLAGGWASAMTSGALNFSILDINIPTVSKWGLAAILLILIMMSLLIIPRRRHG